MSTHSTADAKLEGKAPRNYHPENIEGKAIVVTGGTTGIGRATARLLVERGARVLIYGRSEEDLQSALNEIRDAGEVHGIVADQSKQADIQRIFAKADTQLGGVDVLVNNAAVSAGSVLEYSYDEISYVVQTNVVGHIACTQEAVQRMKAKGSGHIVNVGSMSADVREPEIDIYVATKGAIQAFSESLRKTVNMMGIKVSLIEPGKVGTDMNSSSPEEQEQQQEAGEMLTAEDLAECVHYVLTQPARCDVVAVQIRPHGQGI